MPVVADSLEEAQGYVQTLDGRFNAADELAEPLSVMDATVERELTPEGVLYTDDNAWRFKFVYNSDDNVTVGDVLLPCMPV
ncbi:hypothetical protein HC928_02220 [bacterium]|nr:hypothetical protein [bacterium]